MEKLSILRSKIDIIDSQLIKIVSKRFGLVAQVGKYKKYHNIPPLDKKRWDEVMQSRCELGKNCGLSEELIRDIFEAIHREALIIESNIQNDK